MPSRLSAPSGIAARTNGDRHREDTLTVALCFGRLSCADGDGGDLAIGPALVPAAGEDLHGLHVVVEPHGGTGTEGSVKGVAKDHQARHLSAVAGIVVRTLAVDDAVGSDDARPQQRVPLVDARVQEGDCWSVRGGGGHSGRQVMDEVGVQVTCFAAVQVLGEVGFAGLRGAGVRAQYSGQFAGAGADLRDLKLPHAHSPTVHLLIFNL